MTPNPIMPDMEGVGFSPAAAAALKGLPHGRRNGPEGATPSDAPESVIVLTGIRLSQ